MFLVGTLRASLYLPSSHGLKEKRAPLKSLLQQLRNRYPCSCCETGGQDLHQRAEIGVAVAASDAVILEKIIQDIEQFIQFNPDFQVLEIAREDWKSNGESSWPRADRNE